MADSQCPGCDAPIDGVICCDPCWDRVPTNLPDHPRWRSRLRGARRGGGYGWSLAEEIHDAVRGWLASHRRT